MPFSPIVVNTKTYVASGTSGRYMLNTVTFGDPLNYFKVSGGSYNPKTKTVSAGVTRHVEKSVTEGTATVIKTAVISLSISTPKNFTSTEVDALTSDISEFLTPSVLDRLLNGES